jgi:hypothetical protein
VTGPMTMKMSTAESMESDKSEQKSSLVESEEEDDNAESHKETAAMGPTPSEISSTAESKEEKVEPDESEDNSSEEKDTLELNKKSKFDDTLQIAEDRATILKLMI